MNKFKYILFLLIGTLVITSCEDFASLDGLEPTDSVSPDLAITNLASAQAAVNGVYDEMQDPTLEFDGWLAFSQWFSDECDFTGTFPTRLEFGNLNVFPSNTTLAAVFTDYYDVINVVNNILDILPKVEDVSLTDPVKNSLMAEARFGRALCYHYLAEGWGDVPLVLTPTRAIDESLNVATSPRSAIVAQIIEDLEYVEANSTTTEAGRGTAQAATALLARIYLIEGNYSQALAKAEAALGTDFDLTAFDYLADEIFYLKFTSTDGSTLNFFYGPAEFGGRHSIEPSAKLIGSYEDGDIRFARSIDTTSATVPFGTKYNDFCGGGCAVDPVFFLRHAEMVLIAAEAAAEQGDFTKANAWFNQVRARAGLGDLTLDANNYVDLILQERFVELAMEGNHRLTDLRRRGMAESVLGGIGYESCDAVWPLPQRDIDRNPNLSQASCCNC